MVPSKRVKGDILLCSSSRIEEKSPCKSNRVEIAKVEDAIMKIVNMESFDREKIQKVIKKVIINGEDNIEIVWNTDDPFF